MSIQNKIIISLSLLAIVGGISIAVISVSANGKILDTQAFTFIENNDLTGYKKYLLNEASTQIDQIDQVKFDKIKEKYIAGKPLMELQSKYEAVLITQVNNKDQTGFANTYKEYLAEAAKLKPEKSNKWGDKYEKLDQNQLIERAYQKATNDLASGQKLNLSRFSGKHYGMGHNH